MKDKIYENIDKLWRKNTLIHCITNPISINACANAVLSLGARPIMAEHPDEVEEITKTAKALLLNLGNITDVRMKSMVASAEIALKNNIPIVVDAVGVACSTLRRKFAREIIENYRITLIKGNYSEINAIYDLSYKSSGVDADKDLPAKSICDMAKALANRYKTIILASGKTDVVTDGSRGYYIDNGCPQLSEITGTGCMLGAICASYLSVNKDISSALTACCVLGIAGEESETDKGNGTFMVNLMDNISNIPKVDIRTKLKLEEF